MFMVVGAEKLRAISRFRSELSDYDLLPARALPPASVLLPALEIAGGVAVLIPSTRQLGALLLMGLLILFSAAIVVNLRRGRRDVRCACFGAHSQQLSWTLPVRNMLFALILAPTAMAGAETSPFTAAGLAGAALLFALIKLMTETAHMLDSVKEAIEE